MAAADGSNEAAGFTDAAGFDEAAGFGSELIAKPGYGQTLLPALWSVLPGEQYRHRRAEARLRKQSPQRLHYRPTD